MDTHGAWIQGCALGHHAINDCMQDGMEVVLYFVTARPPKNSVPGMLYVMKEAAIVPVGLGMRPPAGVIGMQVPIYSRIADE